MVTERLKSYGLKKNVLVPRVPELQLLEGYYQLTPESQSYDAYKVSKSRLSFSRYLKKTLGWDDNAVARICKDVEENSITVKLSCSYNDILRLSDTKHWSACTLPGHSGDDAVGLILSNPQSAIVYSRDKSGKFNGRCIIHMIGPKRFKVLRCYGVLQFEGVVRMLRNMGFDVPSTTDDTVLYYRSISTQRTTFRRCDDMLRNQMRRRLGI